MGTETEDHKKSLEDIFECFNNCKKNRVNKSIKTCKGYIHFISSGVETVKIFINDFENFGTERELLSTD